MIRIGFSCNNVTIFVNYILVSYIFDRYKYLSSLFVILIVLSFFGSLYVFLVGIGIFGCYNIFCRFFKFDRNKYFWSLYCIFGRYTNFWSLYVFLVVIRIFGLHICGSYIIIFIFSFLSSHPLLVTLYFTACTLLLVLYCMYFTACTLLNENFDFENCFSVFSATLQCLTNVLKYWSNTNNSLNSTWNLYLKFSAVFKFLNWNKKFEKRKGTPTNSDFLFNPKL